MGLEQELKQELQERNKKMFIATATKMIEREQQKENEVNIPAFMEAEKAYDEFKKAGAFNEYGFLKFEEPSFRIN